MAIDDSGGTQQLPLIITVTFDPSNLPRGMVDAADFGDFLEGLQSALSGQLDYDIQTGYLTADERTRYRLVIAAVRQGSVEAYLIAGLFDGQTLQAIEHLLGEVAAGALALDMLRRYLGAIVDEVGKRHGQYISDQLDPQRVGHYFRRFLGHVRVLTSGAREDTAALPPPLVMSMAPGMRKMDDVGVKPEYQDAGGVLLSDDVTPEDVIPFNVNTKRNVESAIRRAAKTGEPVYLMGTVDEPSDRRGTFVLVLPNEPVRSRYVKCRVLDRRDRALIRNAHAEGRPVSVEGMRYYSPNPGGGKPRSIVNVTRVTLVDQTTLWHQA